VAVVVGVLAIVSPRFGSVGNDASPTPSPTMRSPGIVLPGGPEAFADDPRLAQCAASPSDMEFVFEVAHARDFDRYVPNAGTFAWADPDAPVLVAILRADARAPEGVGGIGAVQHSNDPGHRYVCVVGGGQEPLMFGNVDIAGLQIANTDSSPPTTPSDARSPALPDPSEFVGNPWFERCGGLATALSAFEVPRARDIWLYLPGLLGAPELERDDPAFVLVYQGSYPGIVLGAPREAGTTTPTLAPGHHDVCVIVGPITGAGTFTIYGDVSLEDFDPDPTAAATPPPPTTVAPPFPVWPGIAWSDESGTAADPLVLAAFAGPQTCGWSSVALLEMGWPFGTQALTIDTVRRYVRDPDGLFKDGYIMRDDLDLSADLPEDATFAGYRSGDIELWTSPSTIDNDVFLRWPDHVERWPRMENVVTCG